MKYLVEVEVEAHDMADAVAMFRNVGAVVGARVGESGQPASGVPASPGGVDHWGDDPEGTVAAGGDPPQVSPRRDQLG